MKKITSKISVSVAAAVSLSLGISIALPNHAFSRMTDEEAKQLMELSSQEVFNRYYLERFKQMSSDEVAAGLDLLPVKPESSNKDETVDCGTIAQKTLSEVITPLENLHYHDSRYRLGEMRTAKPRSSWFSRNRRSKAEPTQTIAQALTKENEPSKKESNLLIRSFSKVSRFVGYKNLRKATPATSAKDDGLKVMILKMEENEDQGERGIGFRYQKTF